MKPVLLCKNVCISHHKNDEAVLININLSIEKNEKVALLGLNGAGKTSLLLALVGLIWHQGEIFIKGEKLNKKNVSTIRDNIGYLFNVPEDQLLFPKVLDDVAFSLKRKGLEEKQAFAQAEAVLAVLGIKDLAESSIYNLSHGQKQRVALAGAIISSPSLLLLDEPTAGLDPVAKIELLKLLKEQESAQLIATHDLDFATRLCSKIFLVENKTIQTTNQDINAIYKKWTLHTTGN